MEECPACALHWQWRVLRRRSVVEPFSLLLRILLPNRPTQFFLLAKKCPNPAFLLAKKCPNPAFLLAKKCPNPAFVLAKKCPAPSCLATVLLDKILSR
jgi:hypothetical protein